MFDFFTSFELEAFDGQREHTKTLQSVITQAGVTLPLVSQPTLFTLERCQVSFTWKTCGDELKTSVMCWFAGRRIFEDVNSVQVIKIRELPQRRREREMTLKVHVIALNSVQLKTCIYTGAVYRQLSFTDALSLTWVYNWVTEKKKILLWIDNRNKYSSKVLLLPW